MKIKAHNSALIALIALNAASATACVDLDGGGDSDAIDSERNEVINGTVSTRAHTGTFINPYGAQKCSGVMVAYNVVLTTGHCITHLWHSRYRTYFVPAGNATANPYECAGNPLCFEVLEKSVSPVVTARIDGEDDMIVAVRVRRNLAALGTLNRTYAYSVPVADGFTLAANAAVRLTGYGCNAYNFTTEVATGRGIRREGALLFNQLRADTSPYLRFKNSGTVISCTGDSGGEVRIAPTATANANRLVGIHFRGNKWDVADSHRVSDNVEWINGRINKWARGVTPVNVRIVIPANPGRRIARVVISSAPAGVTCDLAPANLAGSQTVTCLREPAGSVATVRLTAQPFRPNGTAYAPNQVTASWRCIRRMTALETMRAIYTPDTSTGLVGPQTITNGRTTDCTLTLNVR